MRKNSIKNTRINQEVQKELSTLIARELKDPRIHPMTSVLMAEVAPDLKTARIHISVMGDEEAKKNTIKGLKSAAPFLRGQLARTINLRNTPELIFILDESIEYGVTMSKLIDEVTASIPDRSGEETGDAQGTEDEAASEDGEEN
ncbi:MAG: 30S ribosome-binding factor RbfA [Lachnospiraceae bacterium]|nr:30S ribosome-binding factor RbfA [Lachnospiraceae bacterium]